MTATLVMYMLSYGPMLYIYLDAGWPRYRFDRFYGPIMWLQEHTPLGVAIDWYVGLFV